MSRGRRGLCGEHERKTESDGALCAITGIGFQVGFKQICWDALIPNLKIVSGLLFIENRHSASFHPSAKS